MKLTAWAVVCKDGSIHLDVKNYRIILPNKNNAKITTESLNQYIVKCNPHRIIKLESKDFKVTK